MRLLLDTHAFLWAVAEFGGLSSLARKSIQDSRNELFVSAACAWEIATKFRIGKLPGALPILQGFGAILHRLQAVDLPVTREHALRAGSYKHEHRDPFDRMLVAQAEIEALTLVSKDRALRQFGVELLW
ncbi:MAG TPA: type II toxin-antitoxin system VapC family toxin [Rhodanobacteraceae bacterium]|nr:type II toxin-antitoxin system VapC family toxin [Rhodanobacteraceae bacterium]